MPLLLQYLIKLSISLAVVFLFYQLILRRLTFYNWNRMFLLGYSLLAFLIPLFNISSVLERTELNQNNLVQIIPVVEEMAGIKTETVNNVWILPFWLLASGSILLVCRLIVQHLSFLRLKRSADLLLDTPVKLYEVDKKIMPFSFGNSIFINRAQHTEEDIREIIRHEFVHVKQKHSVDMMIAEWLCILNWYNPFAWLIRNAMRQNLEFIADSKVVQNGIDRKQYQYLLLKVMGVPQYNVATNFNFSSLKKRIAMMNKVRTAKVHLVRFLFVLPLAAILLLSFRNQIARQNISTLYTRESPAQDTIPVAPAKPVLPKNVKSIQAIDNKVTVTLKDGTRQMYDLTRPEEKSLFEKTYGAMPKPPAPPKPASESTPAEVPVPAAAPEPPGITGVISHNGRYTITLRNGKTETYDMNKPAEKRAFEKNYGPQVPIVPKPPKAPVKPAAPVAEVSISTTTVVGIEAVVSAQPIVSPVAVNTVSADIIEVQPTVHVDSKVVTEQAIFEITRELTSEQLNQLKKQLSLKGFTLELQKIQMEAGVLVSIEGTISDGKNTSRFIADDFKKIIIFRYRYSDDNSGFNIRIFDGSIKF